MVVQRHVLLLSLLANVQPQLLVNSTLNRSVSEDVANVLKRRKLVSFEQLPEATPRPQISSRASISAAPEDLNAKKAPELGTNETSSVAMGSNEDVQQSTVNRDVKQSSLNPDIHGRHEGANGSTQLSQQRTPNQLYNTALENLEKAVEQAHLPLMAGFNYSLPDPQEIGNAGEFPPLMQIVGHNLGNGMGTTAGNIFTGATSLLGNYAEAMRNSFVSTLGEIGLPHFGGANVEADSEKKILGDSMAYETYPNSESEPFDDDFDLYFESFSTGVPLRPYELEDGEFPDFYGDESRVFQAFENLLSFSQLQNGGMQNDDFENSFNDYQYEQREGRTADDPIPYDSPEHSSIATKRYLAILADQTHAIPYGTYAGNQFNPLYNFPLYSQTSGGYGVLSSNPTLGTVSPSSVQMGVQGVEYKSPTELWNEAVKSLQDSTAQMGLPTLDGFNASLPQIATIGNGAGLPEISNLIGSNLGNSIGGSVGNMISGPANLLGATATNIKDSFLSTITPMFGNLLDMGSLGQLGQPAKVQRRLEADWMQAANLAGLPSQYESSLFKLQPNTAEVLGQGVQIQGTNLPTYQQKSPVAVWNEAVQQLQSASASLGLPTLNGFNASLPEITNIGNGAALPQLTPQIGANVGNAIGSNIGNVISGSAGLLGSTASGIQASFLSAMNPMIQNLMSMFAPGADSSGGKARMMAEQQDLEDLSLGGVSCAKKNMIYASPNSVSVPNIQSLQDCQTICQLYSTPLLAADCDSHINAVSSEGCLGSSHNQLTGSCALFFSIDGDYSLDGTASAPVVCAGSPFAQPVTQYIQLIQSSASTTCILASQIPVVVVEDQVKPTIPAVTYPLINKLPEYSEASVSEDDISHYNPEIPEGMKDLITFDEVFQVQNLGDGPAHGFPDWRYCALHCGTSNNCTHWTYGFDRDTYSSTAGFCLSATNEEPKGKALGTIRTISGPRLAEYPRELFGNYVTQPSTAEIISRRRLQPDLEQRKWTFLHSFESPDRSPYISEMLYPQATPHFNSVRRSLASSLKSCNDEGFIYYSKFATKTSSTPILGSMFADQVESCTAACLEMASCVAFQYIPPEVLVSSTRLMASQNQTCLLLGQVAYKLPGDPRGTSGVVLRSNEPECDPDSRPMMTPVVSNNWINEDNEDSGESMELVDGESIDTAKDRNSTLFHGYSLRGSLLCKEANTRLTKTAEECQRICEESVNCEFFSWGVWGGCYLMQEVSALLQDSDMVSGPMNRLPITKTLHSDEVERDIFNCERSSRGTVYSEASVLLNSTDITTSSECFRKCRETFGCFFMTFIDVNGIKDNRGRRALFDVGSTALTADDSTKKTALCLLFDKVSEEPKGVQPRLAVSSEMNCDVIGNLTFTSDFEQFLGKINTIKYPAIITGASVGGAGLVIAVSAYLQKRKRTRKKSEGRSTQSSSPITNMSPTPGVEGSLKNRNAFGMSSPIASPGSVDRIERGSPAIRVEDFDAVEPNYNKSTGKRLKRTFQLYTN